MRLLSPALIVCSLLSITAAAQDNAVTTLRTDVRLTTVDVVVTDGKGNPVHGLKAEDFSVFEDKKGQKITSFEEHGSLATTAYDKPRPGVFTNATAVRGGVNNVLLIDFLNTPPTDQSYLRSQVAKFVMNQPAGSRTAIFGMGSSLHLLQNFTSDPAELKAVMLRLGTKFSPLINGQDVARDPSVEAYTNLIQNMLNGGEDALAQDMAGKVQALNDMTTRESSVLTRNKVLLTLSELTAVARNLSGVNGRKNVYWLSGSFPSIIQRDPSTTGSPFAGTEHMESYVQDTVNALATAQVSLYPVDSRGQGVPPSQTGDLSNPTNLAVRQMANSSNSLTPEDDAFRTSQFQEHATMNDLADGTGGKAYYNTNDLAGAIADAQKLGSQYYTLTYTPPSDAKPGKYRDIKVEVKGKGMHLAYRRGYYAPKANGGKAVPMNSAKTSNAMQPQAPQSSEVLFQVEVAKPAATTESAKVIGGPVFDGLPHGTYQLDMLVDFSTLQFSPDADGKMHGVIDIATVIYDKNGKVLDSRSDRANLALDQTRYQAMLKGGMRYHQIIAVPDKGDGFVRMAVHDAMTDKLGTVQISMASVRESAAKIKQ
jgi:VWFA-related protein